MLNLFKHKKQSETTYHSHTLEEWHAEDKHELSKKPIRCIKDGLLYDTSKAELICEFDAYESEIPKAKGEWLTHSIRPTLIYKGNKTYFAVYCMSIYKLSEEDTKNLLAEHDTDLYIKIFGEPELA